MIKKILIALILVILLILSKFSFTFIANEIIIYQYKHETYNEELIETLYFLNLTEPYIVYYNHGNLLYQEGKYEKAIKEYKEALKNNPSEKRVCDIHVNTTLSMLALINPEDCKNAPAKLKEARENLYKDGCALENSTSGKNKNAEELEEEIKKIEKELEQKCQNSPDPSDPSDPQDPQEPEDPSDPDKPVDHEQEIRDKLKEEQEQSNQQHQDDQNNKIDGNYNHDPRW